MLDDAIKSVLNQTFDDYELIVIDDGSTDETTELISVYPKAKWIHQENSGVSIARNTGVSHAIGEYVCYLDSDDLWDQDYLSSIDRCIKTAKDPEFVFCDFVKHELAVSETPSDFGNSFFFPFVYELGQPLNSDCVEFSTDKALELILRGYAFYPTVCTIKREVHQNYRWDPNVFKSEDFNLFLKLFTRYSVCYLDKKLAVVRIHNNNKGADFLTKDRVHLATIRAVRALYQDNIPKTLFDEILSEKTFALARAYARRSMFLVAVPLFLRSLTIENIRRWARRLLNLS